MISFRFVSIVLLAVVAATPTVHGFVSKSATHGTGICSRTATTITKNTQCFVKFDKSIGQFVPESSDEEASAGYDAVGTLLRHGPQPWIQRTFKNGEYEQAVLKFMAMEKVDRNTAQGNMDAYLRNPNDWAFDRFEREKKGLPPTDYATLKPQKLVLTLAWVGALGLYASYLIPAIQSTPSMQIQNAQLF